MFEGHVKSCSHAHAYHPSKYMKTVQRITEDLEKLTAELQTGPSSSIRDVSPRKKLKKKNPQHVE
ncbi:hypothetical protein KUCAC02_021944, partial [Chaenocephalus aceratus]